jgi:hypothetical protein
VNMPLVLRSILILHPNLHPSGRVGLRQVQGAWLLWGCKTLPMLLLVRGSMGLQRLISCSELTRCHKVLGGTRERSYSRQSKLGGLCLVRHFTRTILHCPVQVSNSSTAPASWITRSAVLGALASNFYGFLHGQVDQSIPRRDTKRGHLRTVSAL